jgi:hypothetical protein
MSDAIAWKLEDLHKFRVSNDEQAAKPILDRTNRVLA